MTLKRRKFFLSSEIVHLTSSCSFWNELVINSSMDDVESLRWTSGGACCSTHEFPWNASIENSTNACFEHAIRTVLRRVQACTHASDSGTFYDTNPCSQLPRIISTLVKSRTPVAKRRKSPSGNPTENPQSLDESVSPNCCAVTIEPVSLNQIRKESKDRNRASNSGLHAYLLRLLHAGPKSILRTG
jgi:hypothetical protein